jgi:hypothetical protein
MPAVEASRLTLTQEELYEITGYRKPFFQRKFFMALGVPCRRRQDGTLSVCREHYLGAVRTISYSVEEPKINLNW